MEATGIDVESRQLLNEAVVEPRREHEVRRNSGNVWLIAAAVSLFLVLGFLLYRSTGMDDCYISYWPAHTLAHYGRIINYSGEAVEQSSSMLWVLMLGALAFLTRAPVPLLGPLLSIAGGALAVVLGFRLAARLDQRIPPYALFLMASATYLLYWSFTGMETSFVGACTAWLALAYSDYLSGVRNRRFEIVAATICCELIRPEMGAVLFVLLIGLAGALWIRRKRSFLTAEDFKAHLIRLGFLGLVVVGAILGFAAARWGYFHSIVPEPALAKGGRHPLLRDGFVYLTMWFIHIDILPAVCLLLAGIVWALRDVVVAPSLNMIRLVCSLLLVTYGCFIVWVGGDWMILGRFTVHVLPVALVLAADALVRFTPRRLLGAIGLVIIAFQLFAAVRSAGKYGIMTSLSPSGEAVDPTLRPELSWFERNDRLFVRDATVEQAVDRVVTRMLATGHSMVHLYSGQMGIVMYRQGIRHFGHIDVTDRHGLADGRMVHCERAADRARKPNGLAIDYSWYLPLRKELERDCGIPSPDIIYDVENPHTSARAVVIHNNGYALVFHKICDVPRNRAWPPGYDIKMSEFIAVRRDLLPILGCPEVPADQFQDSTQHLASKTEQSDLASEHAIRTNP